MQVACALSTLVAVAALTGCGAQGCPNDDVALTQSSPTIDSLRLDGQVDDDPWELVFVADYRDANGDLGRGQAYAYLNGGSESLSMDMLSVFRQSAVVFDATQGTVQLPLRFNAISQGDEVTLGMQFEDEAKHLSNCYRLDLRFAVQQIAQRLQTSAERLWRRWWRDEQIHG